MNIIFDLDGTLIDASERMYRLFQYLVPQSDMTKNEYWSKKRNSINHQMLLQLYFPDVDFGVFNKKWLSLIETTDYLAMDRCYSDTIAVLEKLSKRYPLYLLTARQSSTNLFQELDAMHLTHFFSEIFVTANRCSKEELLERVTTDTPEKFTSKDWFISDMGKDIVLGNKLNFHTVAIAHGFMAREKLMEYNPANCIQELTELMNM